MRFYEQAHITVKGESLDVEELVGRLQDYKLEGEIN